MKISENLFRKIILEEYKKILSESIAQTEDGGPFERGDKVIMTRKGSPPARGTVMNRRKASGLKFPGGIADDGDKYVYDVALGGAPGKLGSRLERMVPGAMLKRAGPVNSSLVAGSRSPNGRGGSDDKEALIHSLENAKIFNLRATVGEDYLNAIDDIENEIEDGNDVIIELGPLGANVMALYGIEHEGSGNRFRLGSSSAAKLAQFSNALEKFVSQPSMFKQLTMREQFDPFSLALGVGAVVALAHILAHFSKGDNDSRRQARNQAELLDVARRSVENGCEVEVETDSSASSGAETEMGGEQGATSIKGSGKNKSQSTNASKGRIIVKSCPPKG